MSSYPLNSTAASLLGFLHAGPMSGWDLARTAETVIGDFWSLTQSQVYRELSAMAEVNLIEPSEPGRRQRRTYSLTASGRAAFASWLSQEPGQETIRFPLLLTMSFGRHLAPELLGRFVATHREIHAERLAAYQQQRDAAAAAEDPDPYLAATLDFGMAYEQAVLGWFDRLPGLLELPDGGTRPAT